MEKIPSGEILKKMFTMLSVSFLIWGISSAAAMAADTIVQEPPIAITVKADAGDPASERLVVDIKAGDFFKVELFAASGTGYEWELLNKTLQLVKLENRYSVMEAPNLAGGKMRTVYILQAKPDTAGQEIIVFSLRRSWQPANTAAKTVNCEVRVSKE